MAILLSINNNNISGGFLLAPANGINFPVPLTLQTDDGSTINATLQFSSNGANAVLSNTIVQVSPLATTLQIHAGTASASRNDTVLQVLVGGVLQVSFNLTAITNPKVKFKGRFQTRFATSGDYYNDPRGHVGSSLIVALEGEPDFVPTLNNVPLADGQFVGRVIRFSNPEVMRSHVAAIGVSVNAIIATVGGTEEVFTVGDPIIGMPVDLGPNCYFSGNRPRNPADPAPYENHPDGGEPLGNFEFHIGNVFSGKSATLADRPIGGGATSLTPTEQTQYAITSLSSFNTTRRNLLTADFNLLSPADQTGTAAGRNITARIDKINGGGEFGYLAKQINTGLINGALSFSPTDSSVLGFFSGYNSFNFTCKFFNFHSDDMCGQVDGDVIANTSLAIPALQTGVYNVNTLSAGAFNALTIDELTPATITGIIGGGGTAGQVAVTVSPDYDRIVVSKVVITNPLDPPASWQITSRNETVIGEFLPQASNYPRDLYYRILQPNDANNSLGICEGSFFVPPPQTGYARLFADGAIWKLLLHAGTQGAAGITYQGSWSGSTATTATTCTPLDVELLTPNINFGNVEEGMTMYREIVLLNRTAGNVTIALPAMPAPFGAAGPSTQVIIPAGATGVLLVSFVAGTPGASGPTSITLTSNPIVTSSLIVNLSAVSVAVVPVDTVLVLDRSGSMDEPALDGARTYSKATLRNEAVQVFIDLLRPSDRIGLVRFNQDAQPHMTLQIAGPEVGGTGRVNAAMALTSSDLNSQGSTSIGDGLTEGNTMLSSPGASPKKAIVALTDGKENADLRIAAVTLSAGVSAYAIGLGLPQNINVEKLNAVTGNTGGYLLVTGILDVQNEFKLHKYFAQVLSGISGSGIVVDPPGLISAGQTQRVPFYISEADADFDVILLTRFPVLQFWLEAPDGTVINQHNVSGLNGQYIVGKASKYYRMKLPVFMADISHSLGKWHIVIDYPGQKTYYKANQVFVKNNNGQEPRNISKGKERIPISSIENTRSYTVLVKARSAIQLETKVETTSTKAGSVSSIVSYMKAFGLPLNQGVNVYAHITRPDNITTILPLEPKGNGRYEAIISDNKLNGVYNITVKAAGQTPGNWPLQREQAVTATVVQDIDDNNSNDKLTEIKDQLQDLGGSIKDLNKLLLQLLSNTSPIPHVLPAWLFYLLILIVLMLFIMLIAFLQK